MANPRPRTSSNSSKASFRESATQQSIKRLFGLFPSLGHQLTYFRKLLLNLSSEGSFIYAVNVVNYVKERCGSCVFRLDKVLHMTRFHKICILGSVYKPDPEILKRILGFALFPNFFRGPVGVSDIEQLLGLPSGNVIATLRHLDPILHFELPPAAIRSFRFQINGRFKDFFLDRTLSQEDRIDCHEWLEDTFRNILRSVSQGIRGGDPVRYVVRHPQFCIRILIPSMNSRSSLADIVGHFLARCFADHPDPNRLIRLVRASLEQDPWLDGNFKDSLMGKDVLSTIRGILFQVRRQLLLFSPIRWSHSN